jgi:hypothetical protein
MSVPMANKRISSDHINLRDALLFASGYACRYTLSCVRVWPRLCKNALFSKNKKLFTTQTNVVMSKPAAFGTTWQYCSCKRINIPLLKITFCFYTAWAVIRPS